MPRHIVSAGAPALAAVILGAATAVTPPRPAAPAVEAAAGTRGMVSSADLLATEAGLNVLKRGGNAFDAAVAVAAALNVVEPMMSGMGGYGTILVYDAAKGRVRFLNASGRIPSGLDPDVFRPPDPRYLENREGPAAVSTPGNVHAWEALSREYGALAWKDLFTEAIGLAERGFLIGPGTAAMIDQAYGDFPAHARSFYGADGRALRSGERLVQTDLARSLRLVAAAGARAFYEGEIARAIDSGMRDSGGALRLDDLKGDRAEWWEPIHVPYRGHVVYTASPPSTAFPSLIRLGLMSRFDVARLGPNSTEFLHRFIEVTKHAFWCRLRYAGDPGVSPPPLGLLLSEGYWADQAARIDPARARPFVYPGVSGGPDRHTTHFVVADATGNVVSATQTLGNAFGSRIMPEGTGIWLNNSLAYCTFEPKGNPMDAHPGRRKLSGDCPTIIVRDGKPWAVLGTPGGHTIGQVVPQLVMNLVDFGLDIDAALAAPRVSFVEPDVIAVERGLDPRVLDELAARGHRLRAVGGLGNAHALTIAYGPDGRPAAFRGAADPRGHGLAKGW